MIKDRNINLQEKLGKLSRYFDGWKFEMGSSILLIGRRVMGFLHLRVRISFSIFPSSPSSSSSLLARATYSDIPREDLFRKVSGIFFRIREFLTDEAEKERERSWFIVWKDCGEICRLSSVRDWRKFGGKLGRAKFENLMYWDIVANLLDCWNMVWK